MRIFFFLFLLSNHFGTTVVGRSNKKLNSVLLRYVTESYLTKHNNSTLNSTRGILSPSPKKWQVDKIKDKKYEIVNLLWKKTKIFLDTTEVVKTIMTTETLNKEQTQVTSLVGNPSQGLTQMPKPQVTPKSLKESYIEFYYFNEMDFNKNISRNSFKKNHKSLKHSMSIKSPCYKKALRFFYPNKKQSSQTYLRDERTETTPIITSKTVKNNKVNSSSISMYVEDYDYHSFPAKIKNTESPISDTQEIKRNDNISRHYDRVKFFDIYDSDTYSPLLLSTTKKSNITSGENTNDDLNYTISELNIKEKENKLLKMSNLEPKRTTNNNVRNFDNSKSDRENNIVTTEARKYYATKKKHKPQYTTMREYGNISKIVSWSEYPFVAAYVYEPLNVQCDAAAISAHWLISSAACLYRHHKNPKSDERSAYVTYCSDNWKIPERISYVRRSILHPQFNPKEPSRIHLYNIGTIQVVNSMATTCSGWSSVTLMSHQVAEEYNGTTATALGWGLDRYNIDTSDSNQGIGEENLMIYRNLIYLKSCQGIVNYDKTYEYSDIMKDLCCFSLPISSKDSESVHGALLLFGGKLLALYLQEEGRFFNRRQSAIYTGIWRHIPWIFDVAREPEHSDFLLDIL